MMNFKSGLVNCIVTIITIPLLILFIVFSSMYKSAFYIVFFTLFATFSLLYFLFSTLQDWIPNEKARKIFKRFVNICKIITLAVIFVILIFTNIPTNLAYTFLTLITILAIIYIIFSAIWENIPQVLKSICLVATYIVFTVFFFMFIFI